MSGYDPRDYCESRDELAREVLDREEYGEWRKKQDDEAAVRALRRSRRPRPTQSDNYDPWGAA